MYKRQGCAIGLGNVWRFPYITGEYGGAAFVLMYLVFLVILGLPVMVMEFAVGRASQKSAAVAFDTLQPSRKWHWFSWWGYIGCMEMCIRDRNDAPKQSAYSVIPHAWKRRMSSRE